MILRGGVIVVNLKKLFSEVFESSSLYASVEVCGFCLLFLYCW